MPKKFKYILLLSVLCAGTLMQVNGDPLTAPQVVVKEQPKIPKIVVDFAPLTLLDQQNPNNRKELRVITVVDTEAKKIAVYHEDLQTGKVLWLSTRSIQADLQIDQYNATNPLPSEVRREIERLKAQ